MFFEIDIYVVTSFMVVLDLWSLLIVINIYHFTTETEELLIATFVAIINATTVT